MQKNTVTLFKDGSVISAFVNPDLSPIPFLFRNISLKFPNKPRLINNVDIAFRASTTPPSGQSVQEPWRLQSADHVTVPSRPNSPSSASSQLSPIALNCTHHWAPYVVELTALHRIFCACVGTSFGLSNNYFHRTQFLL